MYTYIYIHIRTYTHLRRAGRCQSWMRWMCSEVPSKKLMLSSLIWMMALLHARYIHKCIYLCVCLYVYVYIYLDIYVYALLTNMDDGSTAYTEYA